MKLIEESIAIQAKKSAGEAARAASESAQLALEAVESNVQHFVAVRDYSRLKDMAEAFCRCWPGEPSSIWHPHAVMSQAPEYRKARTVRVH